MDATLICSDNIRPLIEDIFKENNIKLSPFSNLIFVERNMINKITENTYILFDYRDLNSLIRLLEALTAEKSSRSNNNFITGKGTNNFELFPYEVIQFFEADNNNIYCVVENDSHPYKVKEKLYELEESLDKTIFIRVSKSNIVNIMNISQIIPWFGSKFLLKFKGSNRSIEVTRSYLREFKKHLGL